MTTREEKTLNWYTQRFEREYRDAREEFERLSQLFKDVCWYNFETTCRNWRDPWRFSDPNSTVDLHAHVYERKWLRGCLMESGRFPYWFKGTIRDAPTLPPQIVLNELRQAKEYMHACQQQITAPYDWAPGGHLYDELRRTTSVGHATTQCVYAPRKRKFSSS